MATTTNKPISVQDSGPQARSQPKVTNQPVVADDEEPQEEAKSVSKPPVRQPDPSVPDVATGDEDSIAHWNDRKGAPKE